MRIVAFSDWRRKKAETILNYIRDMNEVPDLILYAGDDIEVFYGVEDSSESDDDDLFLHGEELLKVIEEEYKEEDNYFQKMASHSKFGLCAVAGNDDTITGSRLIRGKKVYNVHEDPLILDNIAVIGLEGAISNIGLLLYTEKEVKRHLDKMIKKVGNREIILVSHQPPNNILDFAIRFGKRHIGSQSLRSFIEKFAPQIKLVICGHVHSQGGKLEYLGDVPILNCASHDGKYPWWDKKEP